MTKARDEYLRSRGRKMAKDLAQRAAAWRAEWGRDPAVFAQRLERDINDLATNLRRLKRDQVGHYFDATQRASLVTAAAKLGKLLETMPALVAEPTPGTTLVRPVQVLLEGTPC